MTKGIDAQWRRTVSVRPATSVVRLRETVVPRTAGLAQIEAALRAGRSVLVVGDVGVGKTHLVDSFAASDAFYETASARPLTHRAEVPAPGTPVWISVGASRDRTATPLGALLDVLPDIQVDVTAPIGTVRGLVLAALRSMGAGRALVVRVDDAHLLDDLSARVLAVLARQEEIQLVATMQTFAAGRSPWFELWKDAVADRVDLAPLTRDEVALWLRGSLGGEVAAEALRQVWEVCAGNPFHMSEVVRSAVASGTLRQESDVWIWSGVVPLSTKVIELVQHEIAHVSPQGRRALDLVSISRGLVRDVLERIVPAPVIDALLDEGLITIRYRDSRPGRAGQGSSPDQGTRTPYLECAPLFSRVLFETASVAQRREILTTLRAVAGDEAEQTGLALVTSVGASLDCGLPEPAARILGALRAGLVAGRVVEVEQIATSALAVLPAPDPVRLDVLVARAQAWRFLDQPARALLDVSRLREELAAADVDDETYAQHLLEAVEIVMAIEQYHHDDAAAALHALAVAERQLTARLGSPLPAEPALRIAVARLIALGCDGRFNECRDEAMALVSGPDAASPHILPLMPLLIVDLVETGRMLAAQEIVQRHLGVAAAHAVTHPWAVAEILSAGFIGLIGLGDVAAAEGVVAMLSMDEGSFTSDPTTGHVTRGGLASLRGRWSDGRAELRAANVQFAASDVIGLAAMTLVSEGLMAIASGDTTAGRELLARADASPRRMYSAYMQAEIRCLRLQAHSWLRSPDLYDQAIDLADWAADRGLARVELDALHLAVFALHADGRLAAGEDLLERAHAVASHVDGRRGQAQLAHVVAMFSRDQDLILVANRELGERGVWLPLSQPPVALTRREKEIAGLAAGGLSSKEIADRLFLSVRTVDSHLSRIFAKAGVRSRRELAAVLHT